jgi:subtilisin family serine protease
VQIMACKCFNLSGTGSMSDVITCLDYARTNGARIINASWGFNPDSLAFSNAFWTLHNAGILVVAAAGNAATNLDLRASYPASYSFDNIVSVASTSSSDALSAFSNYSSTSVHLGAPGEGIWSTFVATDGFYYYDTGTSYAAPFVSGALALLLAQYPAETYQQVISRLLGSTDPLPSLAGKCVTGGRLNLAKAITSIRLTPLPLVGAGPFQFRVVSCPNRGFTICASADLATWAPVSTNTTSASGTFDFTDNQTNPGCFRYYRALAFP